MRLPKQLLLNPLCQFLAAGALIYAGSLWIGGAGTDQYRIQITAGHVASMAHAFEQTWLRPPDATELAALIDDYVRDEILYREAVAAGLHEHDQVIRLRLRQQIESLTADVVAALEPSDQELRDYLEQHAEQFVAEPVLTFEQLYLSPDTLKLDPAAAGKLLAALEAEPDPLDASVHGDRTALPGRMAAVSPAEIRRTFGTGFAAAIAELEPGRWAGPVLSGYGAHLVRVDAVVAPPVPVLDIIRPDVEAAWRAERQQELDDRYYAALRARYTVDRDAAAGQ